MLGYIYSANFNNNQSVNFMPWHRNGLTLSYSFF